MVYVVWIIDRGADGPDKICGPANELCKEGTGFDTAAEAARYRAELVIRHPECKYTIKEWCAERDKGWRDREYSRIGSVYTPVPWWHEAWRPLYLSDGCLFEHMSSKSLGMVSYTENADKGELDRQAPDMAPGRFLKKFYGDKLDDAEIESWVAKCAELSGQISLQITQDADLIEKIYVNGPRSCMAHPVRDFDSDVHPARVYAGPDLAIAYLGNPAEGVSGRAVVWPEKKIYYSVYGDNSRIMLALGNAGYSRRSLEGARVRRIEQGTDCFVMPYTDGTGYANDDGEYLILSHDGEYSTQETEGLCGEDNRSLCDDCDCRFHRDDLRTTYQGSYVCESCRDMGYTYSDVVEEYVRDSEVVLVNGSSSECCPVDALIRYDFVIINSGPHEGEYWHIDSTVSCEDCSNYSHEDDEGFAVEAENYAGELVCLDEDAPHLCGCCRDHRLSDMNQVAHVTAYTNHIAAHKGISNAIPEQHPAPVGDTQLGTATQLGSREEVLQGVSGLRAWDEERRIREQIAAYYATYSDHINYRLRDMVMPLGHGGVERSASADFRGYPITTCILDEQEAGVIVRR